MYPKTSCLIDPVALLSTVNRKQSSLEDFFSVENYLCLALYVCVFVIVYSSYIWDLSIKKKPLNNEKKFAVVIFSLFGGPIRVCESVAMHERGTLKP